MTIEPAKAGTIPVAERGRDLDLVLASIHLRLGALGLARAELETLAGRNLLDDEGIRDLAEARWRTGDTAGAGEAAATYLESAPDDVLALVIAAEAQSETGRPAEARRLAGRAVERANGTLDPIFAGLRRSGIWPAEPGSAVGPVGGLFDGLHPGPVGPGTGLQRRHSDRPAASPEGRVPHLGAAVGAGGAAAVPTEAVGLGLWGDEPASARAADGAAIDPMALFLGARRALDLHRDSDAATALILALRGSPALAPAILDLLSGRADPLLVLVRGDAHRIVGREMEAMRDHAAAAARLVDLVADPVAPAASESAHRHAHAGDAAATAPATPGPTSPTVADAPASDSPRSESARTATDLEDS
jgi:hypothetical protein